MAREKGEKYIKGSKSLTPALSQGEGVKGEENLGMFKNNIFSENLVECYER